MGEPLSSMSESKSNGDTIEQHSIHRSNTGHQDNLHYASASPSEKVSMDRLPLEVLLQIFSYLDPYYLSRTVSMVCVRFSIILQDELFWKKRLTNIITTRHLEGINLEIRNPYTLGLEDTHWSSGRDVLWRDLAVNFNLLEQKWRVHKSVICSQNFHQPHFAAVDAIKIIADGTIIVSGGRDRMVNLRQIHADTLQLEAIYSADRSHSGWVWDIDSYEPDSFFTCGWDNNILHWAAEGLQRLCTFNCGKPVMAISSTRGLVAAGLHTPKIVLLDPRIGFSHDINPTSTSASFEMHSHTVTDVLLVPERNILLSTSEDKTLCFFDLRYHKQCYKTATITRDNSFPRCLGFHKDLIYVGDSRGNVHLTSLGGDISDIMTLNIGTRLITSVVPHTSGATVGSIDKYVRIINPCTSPAVVLWDQHIAGEVTSVDQHKDLIAVSSAMGSVTLFKAKHI